MKDKTITCIQCERSFTLTVGEQNRLLAKGFNLPSRCPDCRKKKSRLITDMGESRKNRGKRDRNKRLKDELYEI